MGSYWATIAGESHGVCLERCVLLQPWRGVLPPAGLALWTLSFPQTTRGQCNRPALRSSGRRGWPSGPTEGYRSVFPTPMAIASTLRPCTGKGSQQLTGLRDPGDRRLRQRLDPHPHPPPRRVPASPAPHLLGHLPRRLQQLYWRPRPARVTCPRVTRSRSPAEGLTLRGRLLGPGCRTLPCLGPAILSSRLQERAGLGAAVGGEAWTLVLCSPETWGPQVAPRNAVPKPGAGVGALGPGF